MFAAKQLGDYAAWAQEIRDATPQSMIGVQVGSVAAALTVAEQGIDAGGHGFEKGAGIISLLPEVADALSSAGYGYIPLVAAGGIADGRGAAAACALGAQGVVMGTRFLSAPEAMVHPAYRKALLAAEDGGQVTVRAELFDELKGPKIWPAAYDGRSIVTESWTDDMQGATMDEIRQRHADAAKAADRGYGVDGRGRAAIWAGTGVGLVKQEQPAGEIVEEVRREAVNAVEKARARL